MASRNQELQGSRLPQALLEMMYKSSNSECDASDNINSGLIRITLGVGRIFDILKQTMRMSWIEILKYNDLEFCPRRSQRTCWGHSGSSRGQDCACRRSSSLSPTILIFFILPILFLYGSLFSAYSFSCAFSFFCTFHRSQSLSHHSSFQSASLAHLTLS